MISNAKQLVLEFEKFNKFSDKQSGFSKIIYDISFKLHQGDFLALIGETNSGIEIFENNFFDLFKDFGGFVKLLGKNIQSKNKAKENLHFLCQNLQNVATTSQVKECLYQSVFQFIEEALEKKWILQRDFELPFKQPSLESQLYLFDQIQTSLSNAYESLETFNKEIKNFTKFLNFKKQDFFATYVLQRNKDPLLAIFKFFEGVNKQQLHLEEALEANSQIFLELIEHLQEKNSPKETKVKTKSTSALELASKTNNPLQEFRNLQQEYKQFLVAKKRQIKESKNIYLALIENYKNEFRLAELNIFRAIDFENYFYFLREYAINKRIYSLLIKNKSKTLTSFLLPKHFADLRVQIQNVLDSFRESEWEVDISDRTRIERIVKNYVQTNINLEFSYFNDLAQKQKSEFQNKRKVLEQNLNSLSSKFSFWIKHFSKVDSAPKSLVQDLSIQHNIRGETEKLAEAKSRFQLTLKEWKLLKIQSNIHLQRLKNVVLENYLMFIESQLSEIADKQEVEEQKTNFRTTFLLKIQTLLNTIEDFQKILNDLLSTKTAFGLDNSLRAKVKPLRKSYKRALFRKYQIFNILKLVGLPQYYAYRCLDDFESLEIQKILIAKALVTRPKVLFFNLQKNWNVAFKNELLLLIKSLAQKQKIAVVLLTDEINLVKNIASLALILHRGSIVEQGNINKIFANPIHPFTKYILDSKLRVETLKNPLHSREIEIKNPTPSKVITKLVEPQHWVSGSVEEIQKWIGNLKL